MSTKALAALLTTKTLYTDYWSERTLDEITTLGQHLLTEPDLDVSSDFRISKTFSKIEFVISPYVQNELDSRLNVTLNQYFRDYDMGIIATDIIIISFWQENNNFYVYFPPTLEDVSFVIRFTELSLMSKFIVDKFSNVCSSYKLKSVILNIKN